MTKILCVDTDPQWPEERRKRVTASDMLVFLGMEPDWWSSSWAEVLHHKINGTERAMDLEGTVNVEHGRRSEAFNLELTGELLGYPVTPHKAMYVNERWPYLGATTDALVWPFRQPTPNLKLTTHTAQISRVIERLQSLPPEPVMLESKNARYPYKRKSGPSNWIDQPPEYHLPQVQTGLHIAGFEVGMLCARLGGRDFSAHLIRKHPDWEKVLDDANERAKAELGGLWK